MNGQDSGRAKFSLPSLIALVAAIVSFTTGAFWGLILAMIAIVFGAFGLILAFLPTRRGGVVSVFAIVTGALGVIAALIKGAMWLAR